jgi:hypothetical protein
MLFDEEKNLIVAGHRNPRQRPQQVERIGSMGKIPAGQLAHHPRMHADLLRIQQSDEPAFGRADVVNPNGSIDQNQALLS